MGRSIHVRSAIEEVFSFLACVPLLSRMLGSCHLVDAHGLSLHFLSGLSVSHLFIGFQLPSVCSSPSEPVSIGVLASWPCFWGLGSRARGFVSRFRCWGFLASLHLCGLPWLVHVFDTDSNMAVFALCHLMKFCREVGVGACGGQLSGCRAIHCML